MIQLAVSGCYGRMGQRITHLALTDRDFQIRALLEHAAHPRLKESIEGMTVHSSPEALKGSDVLIEFTTPEATLKHLQACLEHKVKMVIGTTGLSKEKIHEIQKASQRIPIVFSSNMSVGVNILFRLAAVLAEKMTSDYSMKIIEAHHVHKKDAPSGTAKTLAEVIEKHSGRKVADIQALREGEIVGDHDVIMESAQDTITIRHHAKDRDIFAKGSLVAAKFVMNHARGLYSMQDVLGLNSRIT